MTWRTGGCSYRLPKEGKTLCCAVGVHIPMKVYADVWESAEGKDLYAALEFAESVPMDRAAGAVVTALRDNVTILHLMQLWHDARAKKFAGMTDLNKISLRTELDPLQGYIRPMGIKLKSPEYYEKIAESLDKQH